jgi:hypothetical protein
MQADTRERGEARTDAGARAFVTALAQGRRELRPYDYWLLSDMLPKAMVDALEALPAPAPAGAVFDGRRETNNATRCYFGPATRTLDPVVGEVIDLFSSREVIAALSRTTGANLSKGRLRIEHCQDVDGFWLEPHVDISAKYLTLLIYLSSDPRLGNAGTDVYDASPAHNLVARAPYRRNAGLLFVPGADTWHGFSRRPIAGVRKSIIVNYVSPDWRSIAELAHP